MKKKLLITIFALTLTFSAYAQQYDSENDFEVEREGNAITITGYVGTKTVVRIPPRIQNLQVISIESYAFADCTNIINVTIPNSVTGIRKAAFRYCDSLTSVTFQGTIPSGGFSNNIEYPVFDGDLRTKFYANRQRERNAGNIYKTRR
jgi:uncharacterized protein YdeI (BOF family)